MLPENYHTLSKNSDMSKHIVDRAKSKLEKLKFEKKLLNSKIINLQTNLNLTEKPTRAQETTLKEIQNIGIRLIEVDQHIFAHEHIIAQSLEPLSERMFHTPPFKRQKSAEDLGEDVAGNADMRKKPNNRKNTGAIPKIKPTTSEESLISRGATANIPNIIVEPNVQLADAQSAISTPTISQAHFDFPPPLPESTENQDLITSNPIVARNILTSVESTSTTQVHSSPKMSSGAQTISHNLPLSRPNTILTGTNPSTEEKEALKRKLQRLEEYINTEREKTNFDFEQNTQEPGIYKNPNVSFAEGSFELDKPKPISAEHSHPKQNNIRTNPYINPSAQRSVHFRETPSLIPYTPPGPSTSNYSEYRQFKPTIEISSTPPRTYEDLERRNHWQKQASRAMNDNQFSQNVNNCSQTQEAFLNTTPQRVPVSVYQSPQFVPVPMNMYHQNHYLPNGNEYFQYQMGPRTEIQSETFRDPNVQTDTNPQYFQNYPQAPQIAPQNAQNFSQNQQNALQSENRNRNKTGKARDTFLRRLRMISKFSGDSYKDLKDFIDIVDTLFNTCVNEIEETELYEHVFLQLRGEAKNVALNTENSDWHSIRQALLKHFAHLSEQEILISQLDNLQQNKNETLSEYAKRARELLRDRNSTYDSLSEEQKREHNRMARKAFARGIKNQKLKDRLLIRGASTLEDAIAYAIEAENDAAYLIPNNELYCRICRNNGHRERDCRRRENDGNVINTLVNTLRSFSTLGNRNIGYGSRDAYPMNRNGYNRNNTNQPRQYGNQNNWGNNRNYGPNTNQRYNPNDYRRNYPNDNQQNYPTNNQRFYPNSNQRFYPNNNNNNNQNYQPNRPNPNNNGYDRRNTQMNGNGYRNNANGNNRGPGRNEQNRNIQKKIGRTRPSRKIEGVYEPGDLFYNHYESSVTESDEGSSEIESEN